MLLSIAKFLLDNLKLNFNRVNVLHEVIIESYYVN